MRLFLFIALPLAWLPLHTEAATSITRHGVTWKFDKDYPAGQYANGDWWVVGPVVITEITPTPITGRNGTVVNPSRSRTQGFDDRMSQYHPYSDSLNVGKNLPLTVAANSSVVSCISATSPTPYIKIDVFVVLTVVNSAPAVGSFRPPYIGNGSRASLWKISDVNYGALNTLDSSAITSKPSISTAAGYFDKTWYEQDLTWTGRYLHTSYMASNGYGRDMASRTGDAALLLQLDYTNPQKAPLLTGFVQYGIDIYGTLRDGGIWFATGGHNIGRYAPLLVAATVLNDAGMKTMIGGEAMKFSELQQTFFVSQADVDLTNRLAVNGRPLENYTSSDIGMPEWGIDHLNLPRQDNNRWDAPYRDTCGGQLTGPAMAARVMGLRAVVNWEPFFQYAERHLGYEQSAGYGGEFNSNPTPAFHKQFYNVHKNAVTGSGGDPANPPLAAFSPGDRIQVSKDTNVRSSGALSATLLGVQGADSIGTIVGGPVGPDSNNITWWQVNFDTGVDGWTGQDNYIKIVPTKPAPPTGLRVELVDQGNP